MPAHHYRITVEKLDVLDSGGGGTESVSFFAATQSDLFAEATQLRDRLGCSASRATRIVIGRSLLDPLPASDGERRRALPV